MGILYVRSEHTCFSRLIKRKVCYYNIHDNNIIIDPQSKQMPLVTCTTKVAIGAAVTEVAFNVLRNSTHGSD